jgi:DNA-directed RNA polymerase subunit RPC12/RpoP
MARKARLIDSENRKWEFYCPKCKKYVISLEHGYSSDISGGIYLECPECDYRRAAPAQPVETIKEFLFLMRDIYHKKDERKAEKEQEKSGEG